VSNSIDNNFPEEILKKILTRALSKGGEFSEIYSESTNSLYISLSENKLKSLNFNISKGAGIRVLHGEEQGYAYTDDLNEKILEEIALTAAEIANRKTDRKVNLSKKHLRATI